MEKMFVIDECYGDYTKAGPFDAVRFWDADGSEVVLLCSNSGEPERKIRVSSTAGIFLEEVDE